MAVLHFEPHHFKCNHAKKKQQYSLKGALSKKQNNRDRVFCFFSPSWIPHNKSHSIQRQQLSGVKNKASLLPDLRDEPYTLPLVNAHSITQAGKSSGVPHG